MVRRQWRVQRDRLDDFPWKNCWFCAGFLRWLENSDISERGVWYVHAYQHWRLKWKHCQRNPVYTNDSVCMCHWFWFIIPLLHGWCHMKLLPSQHTSVYTIQLCTSLQCNLIQSHIGRVHVCLGVTYYLHFWQNDWDLLLATVIICGCNGYQN